MRLTITTPMAVAVDEEGVVSVRAADPTGSFGVLRGHADFLTALRDTVVVWRTADGAEHACAVRGGVFRVSGGSRVTVATRDAVAGDDLAALEREVLARFRRARDDEAAARVGAERLQLAALRRIVDSLRPGARPEGLPPGPGGAAGRGGR